ncbi:hypothetical protein SHIRM173S_11866 [Streptomyces hirsutus]
MRTATSASGRDSTPPRWEQQRLGVPTAWLGVVAPTLATLNSALILWIGGMRAVEGHITVGLLVAFQALVARFTAPLTRLNGVAGRIQDFAADVARLKDVENFRADPLHDRAGAGDSTRRLHGHVELQNITFGYNPLDKPLLTGFDLTVGPGRQVALVGGSGSGKSTVSRLISGLYAPWEGVIRIDDRRIEDIPRGALAASVSFVDQDVFLFEGTVRDNVALWDPSIPDEAVVEALRDAALYDVIARRARRHPQPGRAGRPELLRRAAPAAGDRAGAGAAAEHPGPGRGDQRAGRRDRAGSDGQPAPPRLCLCGDRAPAEHGPGQRRDRRPRPRHGRGARAARGVGGARWRVRRAGQGALR